MISAQNFSMPAGYIEDKSSHQWLVEVGDNFTNEKQLKNLVLTKIDGVGKIRVKDIADITVVDNQEMLILRLMEKMRFFYQYLKEALQIRVPYPREFRTL